MSDSSACILKSWWLWQFSSQISKIDLCNKTSSKCVISLVYMSLSLYSYKIDLVICSWELLKFRKINCHFSIFWVMLLSILFNIWFTALYMKTLVTNLNRDQKLDFTEELVFFFENYVGHYISLFHIQVLIRCSLWFVFYILCSFWIIAALVKLLIIIFQALCSALFMGYFT